MTNEIQIVNLGIENCYVITTVSGFILVDTGFQKNRRKLEKHLEELGCRPGNLKLIILTHGCGDHSGNAAYLREKYHTTIAMHKGDLTMVVSGKALMENQMNRKARVFSAKSILLISKVFFGSAVRKMAKEFDGFSPVSPSAEDFDALGASLEKLKRLKIKTIFPGHGRPFTMAEFIAGASNFKQ